MTPHVSDDLPLLLTGEATRSQVSAASEHLRHCDDCRQELASAVVAHAALASARRFAPEVVRPPVAEPAAEPLELPDLSAVFAQVRQEVDAEKPTRRPRRRLAVAAAAVIAAGLIGAGAGVLATRTSGSPSGVSIALSPFDKGRVPAKVTVSGSGHMVVDATRLPALDANHRYEVWLTDAGRTKMQPIGWINPDGKAQLTVPRDLMNSYGDIEVSVQRVDASTYTYSGTSVLRGSYA